MLGFSYGLASGAESTLFAEVFPTRTRYTGMSLAFQGGGIYASGLTPLILTSLLAAGGDPEAMVLDEDFLRAMEYGMPPAGGMGMGIDRLLMALTGLGIRETILFPLVRPE